MKRREKAQRLRWFGWKGLTDLSRFLLRFSLPYPHQGKVAEVNMSRFILALLFATIGACVSKPPVDSDSRAKARAQEFSASIQAGESDAELLTASREIESLGILLRDSHPQVQSKAAVAIAIALQKVGSLEGDLEALLESPEEDVQAAALLVLRKGFPIWPARNVKRLSQIVRQRPGVACDEVILALRGLGTQGRPAYDALVERVSTQGGSNSRMLAVETLARVAPNSAELVGLLEHWAQDPILGASVADAKEYIARWNARNRAWEGNEQGR